MLVVLLVQMLFSGGVFHPGGDVLYNAYLPCDMLLNSYASNDIRGHEKQFFFKQYTDAEGNTHTLNNAATGHGLMKML